MVEKKLMEDIMNHYDYQEGTLVFIAPGQVLGVERNVKTFAAKGWAMNLSGAIGLWVDIGTEGFFSDLKIYKE